jgi:flagellar biosynthetic protein FlhB
MAGDRTEKATPKRREDARKKGQIARGAKLPAAAGFFAALLVMRITGNDWLHTAGQAFVSVASHVKSSEPLTTESAHKMFIEAGWSLALLILPVLSAVMIATVAGNFLQSGFSITPNALVPKWDRLSPVKNLKRIFSKDTIVELLKTFFELGVICLVCYGVLKDAVQNAPHMFGAPASQTVMAIGLLAYELGLRVGGILLLFAAVDFAYKWYTHEKSLRMTKQEVKDEFRHQEGDPMVKSQRRRSARALVQRRLAVEVPRADVVITNPTHFAVALLYDVKKSPAPVVVAKGADLMAKRIIKIARENGVSVVQNPPLARVLYRDVEPGQVIPAEFFRAVAEILAYVYRQREAFRK